MQTTARIDVAHRARDGGVLAAGVAFAGRRGIRAVQARVAGGPWRAATLHTPALTPLTWVQWRVTLPARDLAGAKDPVVEARAVDGAGQVQTSRRRDQPPAGATGYHSLAVGDAPDSASTC